MEIRTIGIVGCGLMGTGLAEVAALAGFEVVAIKATAGPADKVLGRIKQSMDRAVAKGKLTEEARDAALARITVSSDLEALAPCRLVVESTAESLASKRRYLADIEGVVQPCTVIATNTSSLPLEQLATALERPGRFLGLHFFSPVPAMKLVEVGRLEKTDAEAVAKALFICEKLGKSPILLGSEPGYIVNRLLVPYLCHAIEMLEQGVARAKDIDDAMKMGCGHPMGPLALCDLIGLDIVFAMAQTLSQELRDKRFRAPGLLRRLVLAGHVGKKAKLGLYDYRGAEPVENAECRAYASTPALTGS
jgi:3-hydroxybutyryl-CoA dehydrogenase